MDGVKQHWAPPQYCRCGINCLDSDSNQFKYFKIEEVDIRTGMALMLEGCSTSQFSRTRFHAGKYTLQEFLTPQVVQHLNKVTGYEQSLFGYDPYLQL